MSNQVTFVRTKFEDYSGVSYGWRAYDDYESSYNNNNVTPMPEDDEEFFNIVRLDGGAAYMIDFLLESGKGLNIDNTFYEIEEITKWL